MSQVGTERDAHGRFLRRPSFAAPLWQPGRSPNPSGFGGPAAEARHLAREASPAAIRTLIELMNSSPDDKVRAFCAQAVWDRGIGKPKPVEDGGDLALARIALMSPAQRLKLLEELTERAKRVLEAEAADAADAAEGEVVEVVEAAEGGEPGESGTGAVRGEESGIG